jgi:trypsin
MKFCLSIVLALIAIASASRLPLPKIYHARYAHLMRDDPIEVLRANRVVGGQPAAAGERPYQITLLRSGSLTCGGSLVNSQTVLTAAHCIDGSENNPGLFTVRAGSLNHNTGGTVVNVRQIIKHASYSSSRIDFDYAILLLATAISPGGNIAFVTIAAAGSSQPASGTTVVVSGWGRVVGGGALSPVLLKASLAVMDQATCQSRWGLTNTITAQMLCAWDSTQSACNGDSGGPLTLNGEQTAVVSWGSSSCLHQTYPNVYAYLTAAVQTWIQQNSAN